MKSNQHDIVVIAVKVPRELARDLDNAVRSLDSDRSKLIRISIREKMERMASGHGQHIQAGEAATA